MSYPELLTDLKHIHQSEVYGSNVFKMAGRLSFDKKKKAKWALLDELELQTLDRFLNYMQDNNRSYHYPYFWALKGHLEGLVLGLLPWSTAMRLLAHGTESFTVIWLRLKTNANETDQKFFSYIYAHEKAIEAFAKHELEQNQDSVKVIMSLLDKHVKE
ncbi:MAG: hypothetical protein JKY10_09245 [Cohaesibacteraceae bacterium]|nr:hypothetical protein [Cohaesibacteraceae bacterium]